MLILTALFGFIIFAGGCAVDQRKEVAQYRQVLDGKNPPAVDDSYDGKPLSLEEAFLLANRRNEQLSISGESYVRSLIAKERAFAAFLPTISLAPTYTYLSKPSVINTQSGNELIKDVAIAANGNVFNGFRDMATLQGSGYTIEQRKAQLLDMQQTIFLDVAATYYQILSSERSVLVLTNSVTVQDANVSDMQDRERTGVARPLDVAQSEAQAAAAAQLISAKQDVVNGRTMLAYLIDAKVDKAVLVDRLDVPKVLLPIESALAAARADRPDVLAVRQGVEAARQAVISALGEMFIRRSRLNWNISRTANPSPARRCGRDFWTSISPCSIRGSSMPTCGPPGQTSALPGSRNRRPSGPPTKRCARIMKHSSTAANSSLNCEPRSRRPAMRSSRPSKVTWPAWRPISTCSPPRTRC